MKKLTIFTCISFLFFACGDYEDENLDFSNSLPQYVEITSSDFEGVEGDEVTVTISLGEAQPNDVTVGYSVTGDITETGSVEIPKNTQTATISVIIPDNETLEANGGSATLALSSVDNELSIGRGGPDAGFSTTEILIDWVDDLKEIALSVDTINAIEQEGEMMFIISAGNPADANISVNYSISGDLLAGVDYVTSANPVIIEAGTTQDTIIVTFTEAFDNAALDGNRDFFLELLSITGGNAETSLKANQSLGRIFADDTTMVSFTADTTSISGTSVISIPVQLSNLDFDHGNLNSVTYSITGGTPGIDYNDLTGGTIDFALQTQEDVLLEILDAGTDVILEITLTGSNDPETVIAQDSNELPDGTHVVVISNN